MYAVCISKDLQIERYSFKMYLRFVLIRYDKVTDMETMPLKEEFIIYSSQEEGACHSGPRREAPTSGRRQEV